MQTITKEIDGINCEIKTEDGFSDISRLCYEYNRVPPNPGRFDKLTHWVSLRQIYARALIPVYRLRPIWFSIITMSWKIRTKPKSTKRLPAWHTIWLTAWQ